MFSSIQQATLLQVRYPNRQRSISAGQVHSMLLLMAGGFPRLNERGSIEAELEILEKETNFMFPRLNERGSIEAFGGARFLTIFVMFPRLNERGSIEALCCSFKCLKKPNVSTFE